MIALPVGKLVGVVSIKGVVVVERWENDSEGGEVVRIVVRVGKVAVRDGVIRTGNGLAIDGEKVAQW